MCHHHFAPFHHVGLPVLVANASVAFFLNLATMALIKHTSALTLNVAGVFKDIGLIVWSVLVSGAVVTNLQYFGYFIAIVGVSLYSSYKRAQSQATPPPAEPAPEPSDAEAQPLAPSNEPTAAPPADAAPAK